jgi:outer membrane protein assembly factor BamB
MAALALVVTACAGRAPPSSWPGLTLDGDTVYVAYGQHLFALNAATGQQRWLYPAEAQNNTTFFADPAIQGDLVVVGSYDTSVYGVNASTGALLWPAPFADATDHIVGAAAVDDGTAYVPSADYSLYALDTSNGTKLWSFKANQAIWAKPLLAGGRLYVSSLDHHLYALDPQDGTVLWDRQLGGAIAGTPALSDGLLIVGAFDNKLYAVNAASGEIAWTQPTDGWVWSGPLVEDGTLYFGDLAGYLYSARADTGEQIWKVKPGGALRGTPALADGVLYAPSRDGFVYFRSAEDGAPAGPGEVEIGGQLLSTPVIAGDSIIVGAYGARENKLVFALDANSGAERWTFTLP